MGDEVEALSKGSSALQKITKAISAVTASANSGSDADAFRQQARHHLHSAAVQRLAEPRVSVAPGVQQGDEVGSAETSPLLFKHIAYRRRSELQQAAPDEQVGTQNHDVRRISDALLDTGASFNVVDAGTVKRMEREGAKAHILKCLRCRGVVWKR